MKKILLTCAALLISLDSFGYSYNYKFLKLPKNYRDIHPQDAFLYGLVGKVKQLTMSRRIDGKNFIYIYHFDRAGVLKKTIKKENGRVVRISELIDKKRVGKSWTYTIQYTLISNSGAQEIFYARKSWWLDSQQRWILTERVGKQPEYVNTLARRAKYDSKWRLLNDTDYNSKGKKTEHHEYQSVSRLPAQIRSEYFNKRDIKTYELTTKLKAYRNYIFRKRKLCNAFRSKCIKSNMEVQIVNRDSKKNILKIVYINHSTKGKKDSQRYSYRYHR